MSFIQPLKFGSISTKNNLILAPLAGYSHKPMRMMNRKYGAGYSVTEMVSVEGILRDSRKTLRYADISDAPELTSIQIFGSGDTQRFYDASKILQNIFGVRSININFGCPAPKVLKNGAGAYFLDEPQKIIDIINAVKDSGVSVEVKIRCGFHKSNLESLISHLDRSDVDVIMMHCRLVCDRFLFGTANWDYFETARTLTNKILIANGDIKSPEDALVIFKKYKMDGLMIGRGAIAKPYLFQQIIDFCSHGSYTIPSVFDLLLLLKEYAELWFAVTGFETIIPLRSAMISMFAGFKGAQQLRSALAQTKNIEDVYKIIDDYQLGETL